MNILKIRCHCGKILTDGEYEHYEYYRQPKKLGPQCYHCSIKETEKIKERFGVRPSPEQEKELETEYYKDVRNFEFI